MTSRLAACGAGLCVLLLAGSACAGEFTNFAECSNPAVVPNDVMSSILTFAASEFGNTPEKTCNSVTKKGVSICKVQVKAAAKCNTKTANSNYDIEVKQCATLNTGDQRSACKNAAKALRSAILGFNKSNQSAGLNDCAASFEAQLQNFCINGVP